MVLCGVSLSYVSLVSSLCVFDQIIKGEDALEVTSQDPGQESNQVIVVVFLCEPLEFWQWAISWSIEQLALTLAQLLYIQG